MIKKYLNVYEDSKRAEAYSKLAFPGTYHLAYRDLPRIIIEHVKGIEALDFGCGTGRSTRFLQDIGFSVIGVDIAEEMIKKAKEIDPKGDYRLVEDEGLIHFKENVYDLILSVFTFDNIPTMRKKVNIFRDLRKLLNRSGRILNLVSSPEIYMNEWASFTTKNFPENKRAKTGDKVKIVMTDVDDRRPVEDVLWKDADYREVYRRSGIKIVKTYKPLAKGNEHYEWINETKIAPWTIYVLKADVQTKE